MASQEVKSYTSPWTPGKKLMVMCFRITSILLCAKLRLDAYKL